MLHSPPFQSNLDSAMIIRFLLCFFIITLIDTSVTMFTVALITPFIAAFVAWFIDLLFVMSVDVPVLLVASIVLLGGLHRRVHSGNPAGLQSRHGCRVVREGIVRVGYEHCIWREIGLGRGRLRRLSGHLVLKD